MNNYHIYEEIGKGKFSTVYKGRKKKSIEYVAVKMLEKSRRKKVLNEVRIFHNLNHANILKFHNWYETRNHLWIIFEYCAGGDLLQLIEQDKAIGEPAVRNFGRDLVHALLYLHSHGIIYCDLKPSNVLFNEYGSLKLCDFGLAKRIVDLVQVEANAETGPKKGTPYYMAPELFQDEGVHSFASDFWALGCILFELAVGRPPFTSSSFQELVGLILNSEVTGLEKLSPELADLLTGLLQKNPSKRMGWDELKQHQFWHPYEFPQATIPSQPHFETYLKSKGLVVQPYSSAIKEEKQSGSSELDKKRATTPTMNKKNSFTSVENTTAYSSTKTGGSSYDTKAKEGINLLRMSQNIIKNRIKESNVGYEVKDDKELNNKNDIKLHKDQELNFGDKDDEEDDEDESDKDNNDNQEESAGEEEADVGHVTKIDFNKRTDSTKSPRAATPSNKGVHSVKVNNRNLKAEADELSVTPKNGRSNSTLHEDAERLATANLLPQRVNTAGAVNTQNTQSSTKSKIPPPEQLIHHTSDTIVKPITGNKEIEKIQETVYNRELLPFNAWALDDVVAGIETPQVESHLADIYGYLGSNTNNVIDKINVLNYFETVVQNSNVSNRLVNSAFMNLLVKLLKTSKNVNLKAKVCCIIGQLIRHATVIDNELSQLNLPAILAELLKEKNDKLKRKAIAAMGEYLFYGATQMDEDNSESTWDISSNLISLLNKIVRSNEEETVRFYACKTIENITAQSINAGSKFANLDTVTSMFATINTTKNENLKICATVCLNHVARLNPSLITTIIENYSVRQICLNFTESHPRIQQVLITLVDLYLQTNGNKAYTFLAEEKLLIPALMSLLDHSSVVIRGKTLLALYFMFKINLKWMMILAENKFGPLLDKLKGLHKYTEYCLIHLVDLVVEIIPRILKNISDELKDLKKLKQKDDTDPEAAVPKEQVTNFLGLLPMVLGTMNSSILRGKIVTNSFLLTIFGIYDYSEGLKDSINEHFRTVVFMIFESLSSNHKLLVAHNEVVLQVLFPSLLSKLASENADTRFNSLKLLTDIMIQYLNEDAVYDVAGTKPSARVLNEIIGKKLLPNLESILNDVDPVPQYGLKLFSIIFTKNIQFVAKLNEKSLHIFLEYFNSKHPKLTTNTLKIIQKIVECKQITFEALGGANFVEKAVSLLRYFWANQQEWCYEELLDIFYHIFLRLIDTLKANKLNVINPESSSNPIILNDQMALSVLKQYDSLTEIIDILAPLSAQIEIIVAEKSLNCLMLCLYLFGAMRKKDGPLKSELTFQMANVLAHHSKQGLWVKEAKCLLWFCYIQDYKLYIPADKKSAISSLLDKHKLAEDKTLASYCREIQKALTV